MPKIGEINYLKMIGAHGADHALNKPFADEACSRYLADLGLVMTLLPTTPARLLDLGVGSGWTTAFLARRGYAAVGRDICPDMIELAKRNRERYQAGSATFEIGDYESMPYRAEFDAALFYDSLHHAEDERAALGAVHAALRPGGVCVTVEPGEGHGAASTDAATAFGVTEKDMPPHHIIAMGREVGFQEFRVYARPTGEPILIGAVGPTGAARPERPSRWRVTAAFARKALRALFAGVRNGDDMFLFRQSTLGMNAGNVVWMRK